LVELIRRSGGLRGSARLVGVHFDTVGRWRDGQQKMPFQAAAVLCGAANLSLDWLAHGDDTGEASEPTTRMGTEASQINAKDVRDAAEFIIRVTSALEGITTKESSDAIANAIVLRARDIEAQRALKMKRASEEKSQTDALSAESSGDVVDFKSDARGSKTSGVV
jgi:hypothetical protein